MLLHESVFVQQLARSVISCYLWDVADSEGIVKTAAKVIQTFRVRIRAESGWDRWASWAGYHFWYSVPLQCESTGQC